MQNSPSDINKNPQAVNNIPTKSRLSKDTYDTSHFDSDNVRKGSDTSDVNSIAEAELPRDDIGLRRDINAPNETNRGPQTASAGTEPPKDTREIYLLEQDQNKQTGTDKHIPDKGPRRRDQGGK